MSFADDILETFLSEYRKNKKFRHAPQEIYQHSSPRPITQVDGKLTAEKTGVVEGVMSIPEDFQIPELPLGKELVFNILATWGDKYYVGLTGIEVFTASGEPAVISEVE